MIIQQSLLEEIIKCLSFLELWFKNRGKSRLYDQHIVAETFFADMLNIIYDYNLINLNHSMGKNYPAIDLGDIKHRVAFQVTSDKSHQKIQDSIDSFVLNQYYLQYDKLQFLILGNKQKTYKNPFNLHNCMIFDAKTDVIGLCDLQSKIESLDTNKLKEITNLIKKETDFYHSEAASVYQTDIEALSEYRKVFKRPALLDPFMIEGNFTAFEQALTDLITLVNKGELNGKYLAKTRFEFEDNETKDGLELVADKIRILRNLYKTYVKSGEIEPERNCSNFKNPGTHHLFDNLKNEVLDEFDKLLVKHNLSGIGKN